MIPILGRTDTTGGTLVTLSGSNLWDDEAFVAVTVTTPGGTTPAAPCVFAEAHAKLVCALAPGAGAITLVTITVLGQSASLSPPGLAYLAPVVTAVAPAAWPTLTDGVVVTVTGRSFGLPSQFHLVAVTVTSTACSTLSVASVAVRGDSEMSFEVRHACTGGVGFGVCAFTRGGTRRGWGLGVGRRRGGGGRVMS
jgi:hypothetical protein